MTNKNDQIEISTLGKLAAHVPDFIVYGDFAQEMPFIESFDGVLLFMDISGFTALTEKFSMNTSLDRGADELTQTLNHYVGDIVEEVLVFGGDVLKFAGDALLALWKVERCHLNEIITLALKCSFSIQQEYGVRDTEVGLELRVKIGLSAGHISKVVIGDNRRQHFVVTGRAVEEVRLAQNLAKASEIILSPNCWELCDRNLIEVEKIKNERAVKVGTFLESHSVSFPPPHLSLPEILRTASMLGPNEELEKRLRKYVMKNVLKKIDDNQPLEYLSELRPVTIVFVNMQFEENANTHHVWKAIQDANAMISGTILPLSGNINKVFMFDKGCTFLCIFGLPGDKQADESTNALDSAHKIHAFCSTALMKIKIVSIGVTGGPVFCGVVGHRVRHEYTVIGRKVNLAARMMMFYPGLVSCDALTYSKSKLPHYFFEELPLVEMKGVVNPGTVYQFLGITEKAKIVYSGRKKETDIFENLLEKFKETKISHVIIYEGLMGYGKSQLVTEIAYLGQAPGQNRVVAMELTKINAWQNFFAVRTLMAMFLGVDVCKTYDARQYILLSKLRGVIEEQYLCLFNNLFHVKFPTSEVVSQMDNDRKNKEIETMLLKILINVKKEVLIFAVDEAQFIDKASWDFLDNLLKNVSIFVVMALSPINHKGRILCSSATQILNSPSTTFIKLRELSPSIIIQKACQDLGVVSITRELETFLIQRSHGNPFYCEELLRNLHLNNVLQFHVLEEDEEKEDEWDSLFSKLLIIVQTLYHFFSQFDFGLSLGIALAALDNMNPSEQMVVKCAAVIGVTFTTEMLLYILPEWTKRKMYQTLAALVESRIFKCCSERKEVNVTHLLKGLKLEEAVMHCKIMEFCTPLLQEAAYELWLKNQKKALHFKCTSYLKWLAHRCKCCGEGDFIPYHRYAVDGMLQKFYSQEDKIKNIKEDVLNEAAVILVSETLKKLERQPERVRRKFDLMKLKRTETPGSQDCECKETVESVTVPLSQHYLALGDYSRAFYYLLESASAYVNHSHNYMAFTYLNTAESLLRASEFKHKLINQFEVSILYSLKGEVCYNMGQITSAKKLIKKALSLLKKSFPITVVGAFCMFMVETSKHLSHQNKQTLWQISSIPPPPGGGTKRLAVLFQQGHCLSLLWQLFSLDVARSRKTFTRLAALMQVNCAEESQDESQIISSYMDFSLCYQMMGCQHEWMKYELMAIKRSSHLHIVGGGLLTIAKLASSLAYMKLCLGNMLLAIQLGIADLLIFAMHTLLLMLIYVIYSVLLNIWRCSTFTGIIASDTCLIMLFFPLGFCFKPFKYCQDFILANETNCILMSQNNIMLSLYSSLNLDQIMNQCSISPVYYSRVYHLKAYVQLMLGNDELSQNFLEKGFYTSDIYGNRLERSWLEISKVLKLILFKNVIDN
uniref:Guanylate cyclase domain-containing protein n=1 Tax=Naja naja TaxID=35670 RepID=A0A8C6VGG2_NAJNA